MPSAVQRYAQLISKALERYFPRTTAYLRAEGEAGTSATKPKRRKATKTSRKASSRARTDAGEGDGTHKPHAVKPKAARARGIYSATPMPVTQARIQAMRTQVAAAARAGVVSEPSPAQWAMILSDQPLTRIFAGAGSGKSTTLVLRLVFMICHLDIEPGRITVISFTNASCAELREQLIRVLAFWQHPFDQTHARQCVRTFHSAMGVMAKALLGNPAWFEQLGEGAAAGARELDNPLAGGRLGAAQRQLLQQAYDSAYADDARFRDHVHALLGSSPPDESEPLPRAPTTPFRLEGELSAAPLHEAFFQQAGFMQSIGLRIDSLEPKALACSARERMFCEALVLFWAHFQGALRARSLMTFDDAFAELTARLAGNEPVPAELLEPFGHLLIDEFQDISPQIVQWLQALHRRLAGERRAVSLMAIGDDWQSIYGWRGSSPELFIDFDRHFPVKGKARSAQLVLGTNYRSIDPIVRDGERVLTAVACKQPKQCEAVRPQQDGDHGVRLVTPFDIRTDLPVLLQEITKQCRHAATRGGRERTAVLLLSRRNEPLKQIQAQLDPGLPVKAMTIHRAKGLQAEVAIIIDDCLPGATHPMRNALYARCGFFRGSYDQAMADESLRLAYVAITRGVSRVLWFTRKPQGATALLGQRAAR